MKMLGPKLIVEIFENKFQEFLINKIYISPKIDPLDGMNQSGILSSFPFIVTAKLGTAPPIAEIRKE